MLKIKSIMLALAVLGLLIILSDVPGFAQTGVVPTKVLVRAVSRDAKVIGTNVGGARITVREAATGYLLAEGIQLGGTGDTELIMKKPHERGAKIYDTPKTASFQAELKIVRPTVVEITAEGPLDPRQSTYKASKTLLVVPGQDILGEGILLEIHGFRITLLVPSDNFQMTLGQEMEVLVTVTMTWGCPTEPGGLWDADKIQVLAQLIHNEKVIKEIPLTYEGEESTFVGSFIHDTEGEIDLVVLALDPANANFGIVRQQLQVVSKE